MERNLTTGSVWKSVLSFSLPYLFSYFLQTLYGMADLFIIGQYEGVASTTAVSVGSQVMHMLTVMLVGLAMGATVSIGHAVGAGDRQRTAADIGNTVTLFTAVSLVLTVGLLFLVRPIVAVMSTPQQAVEGTVAYLTVCFIGIPFITAYNVLSSIYRGLGDSRSPMYFIAVACAANIGLDYLFIGVLGLGPVGAALGTTVSQAVSVAAALFAMHRRHTGVPLQKSDFKPRRPVMGQILRIGVPVALQDGLIQIAFILITIIANRRGLIDAAAVGIVEKIICFLFLVPSSMLSTVSALGAQNIGAGREDRARQTLRYAIYIAAGFGLVCGIFMQFFSGQVVALFTDPADPAGAEAVRMGGEYLRGYIWDCLFAGIHFSFSGYFCACGRSGLSFLHNILAIVLVRVPGAYLTSIYFPETLYPMGLSTSAASLVSVIICVVAYLIITRRPRAAQKGGLHGT